MPQKLMEANVYDTIDYLRYKKGASSVSSFEIADKLSSLNYEIDVNLINKTMEQYSKIRKSKISGNQTYFTLYFDSELDKQKVKETTIPNSIEKFCEVRPGFVVIDLDYCSSYPKMYTKITDGKNELNLPTELSDGILKTAFYEIFRTIPLEIKTIKNEI